MPADLPFPPRWRRDPGPGWGGAGQVMLDTAHGYTLWIFDAGLACCAVECAAALARLPRPAAAETAVVADVNAEGAGVEGAQVDEDAAAGTANVLLVAGTVTDKLAPLVRQAYEELPAPKYVLSFGACANSGGPYWDSYCVTKGVDQFVPVDMYVPGCPPRPEALLHGLDRLGAERLAGRPSRAAAGSGAGR